MWTFMMARMELLQNIEMESMANGLSFKNHSDTTPSFINAGQSTLYVVAGMTLGQGAVITSLRVYIFGLLGVFMAVGNSLTLYAVSTTNELRVKSYVMITSLAVNDVIFGLTVIHYAVHESLARLPCSLATYRSVMRPMERMVSRTSFLHIMAIAVDRYVAVEYPLHYGMYIKSIHFGLLIASLWFLSALLSAPAYLSFTSLAPRFWSPTCIVTLWPYFEAVSDLVLYVCNSAVVVFVYVRLWSVAMRHEKTLQPQLSCRPNVTRDSSGTSSGHNPAQSGHAVEANDTTVADANGSSSGQQRRSPDTVTGLSAIAVPADAGRTETDVITFRAVLREWFSRTWSSQHRSTRTALALTASYIVLWFPYLLSRLLQIFGRFSVAAASLEVVGTVIASTNIAMNVILYAIVNRDFRSAFKRLLCVKLRNTIHPS